MDDFGRKKITISDGGEIRTAPPVPRNLITSDMKSVRQTALSSRPQAPKVQPVSVDEPIAKASESPAATTMSPDDDEGLVMDEPVETVKPGTPKQPKRHGRLGGFFGGYWRRKLWALPLTVVAVVLLTAGIAMALPSSRYMVLAYFVQRQFAITLTDSTTNGPVSGADVTLDGQKKTTDAAGKVSFTLPVGNRTLQITKTYYKTISRSVLVDLSNTQNVLAIPLVATGRQVPIKVVNKITGRPIGAAVVTVGGSNAKTDDNGQATIVVAASPDTQNTAVTMDGYNDLDAKLQVTTQAVDANTFALVPAGRMYFLSNLSGKIDVVSTNLDGSDRKTVLAGTGSEDANNTVLLASRDWKYLALLSKRDGGAHPKLYLITTGSDRLTTLDGTVADFSLLGWSDHYFVYQIARPDLGAWQPNATSIASFNADTAKVVTLINTNATGTSNADAQYETILQTAFIGGNLVYSKTWYRYPGYVGVAGQQNMLASIKPDGTGAKTLKTVDAGQYYVSSLRLAKPNQLYFAVIDNNSANANYYRLDTNGNITQSSTITSDSVNKNYPTYLASPSARLTFWSEARDGKNTLFTGDTNGDGSTQIATLSDFVPYGWFGDEYLLVQKSNSELYIMSADGAGSALKLSDYYKPDYSFFGYGGGYGGL